MKQPIPDPITSPELDKVYREFGEQDLDQVYNEDLLEFPRMQALVKKMDDLIHQEKIVNTNKYFRFHILSMLDFIDLNDDIAFLQKLEHDVSELKKQDMADKYYYWNNNEEEGRKIVNILHLAVKDRIQAVLSQEAI